MFGKRRCRGIEGKRGTMNVWATIYSLCSLAGRFDIRQPSATESTLSPHAGTKNLAAGGFLRAVYLGSNQEIGTPHTVHNLIVMLTFL